MQGIFLFIFVDRLMEFFSEKISITLIRDPRWETPVWNGIIQRHIKG